MDLGMRIADGRLWVAWALSGMLGLGGVLGLSGAVSAQDRALAPGLGFTRDFEVQWPVGDVSVMCQHDDGTGPQLYVGGNFYDVNGQLQFMSYNIARWDGRVWSRVGGGLYWEAPEWFDFTMIRSMCVFQGQLYIAGGFNRYWSPQQQAWLACEIVIWNGIHYEQPPSNPVQWDNVTRVEDMIVFDDGTGEQLYFGAISFNSYVMRWSGSAWSRVGNVQLSPSRFCIHDLGQGPLLFALGWTNFSVNGQSAQGLAAWNGTDWILPVHPLPFTGAPSIEQDLVSITEDGRPSLYVRQASRIWRHRDGVWSQVLNVVHTDNPGLERVMAYDDGNGRALFAVGNRITLPGQPAGQYVRFARFDGHAWTAVGTPLPQDTSSAQSPTGVATFDFGEGPDLYIGGYVLHPGTQGLHAPWQVMARYRGAHRDLAAVCGGDGSLARCPCDTRGIVGHGCPNSATANGARLEAQGVARADTLTFAARDLPPSTLALLFQGDAYAYSPVFAGDGVSCTSGTLLRVGTREAQGGVVQIPLAGEPSIGTRVRALGDPLPEGAVRYYQVWYRDPDPAFCASGGLWNTSNGMRVVW